MNISTYILSINVYISHISSIYIYIVYYSIYAVYSADAFGNPPDLE